MCTNVEPHGGQIIEVLEQVDVGNPEFFQDGSQTSMSRRVKGISVVKVYTDEFTFARHCKFEKKLLFLVTVCDPV